MISVLATFVDYLGTVLWVAILIRALMSWVMPQETGGIARVLSDITEPVLAPIRRILPPTGGIDFSPFLAIILITVLKQFIVSWLSSINM